jgi:beta-lactamase superfamily II metal-dependent hydrolase
MQITVFQSAKGDCLLLSDTPGKTRILVDGGMPDAYTTHVAPALGKLRTTKKSIDLVYVSHIDQDHIGGVLRMLDDEVLWRVHEHQKKRENRNPGHKAPKVPRPPVIGALWHNAFHDILERNAGPIEEALAAMAPVLSGAALDEVREAGRKQADLTTSIAEAIRVSRRIGPKQLGIKLNALPNASHRPARGTAPSKLLMVRAGQQPIKLGDFRITIIGPTASHLKKLRDDWNTFLRSADGKKALSKIRSDAREDEKRLGAGDLGRLLAVMALQAEAFGNPKSVTPPNLASLTLLVEEGGKSILLTGDARWDQVIDGLEATGRLQPGQTLTVDVVKVPHHGSQHNVGETTLLDRVVGKDYVFCGDGFKNNPEISVVQVMVKHRLKAPGKFKFWFNSSEAVLKSPERRKHMREVEQTVRTLAKSSGGRMTFKFLENGSSLRVI